MTAQAKNPPCHYLKGHTLERCTAESVSPNGEVGIMLCQRHLAQALEFVNTNVRIAKMKETAS